MNKEKPRNKIKEWIEYLEEHDTEFLYSKVGCFLREEFPEFSAFVVGDVHLQHIKRIRNKRGDKPRLLVIIGGKT
ncbi:MAG TPA: hypothetical protein DEQ20_04900 [Desulfobulbaceae bacterium]|nr:hypothetical protein [Desulfobulbaceae bacterium]